MDLFDVVFPLSIGPLTYRRPAGHKGPILPGTPVRAEIKRSMKYGIVLGKAAHCPAGPIKEIAEIVLDRPLINDPLLRLVKWMAEYYLVSEGVVLKAMPLMEYFEKPKRPRKSVREMESPESPPVVPQLPAAPPVLVSGFCESLAAKEYKTFLFHAPSFFHEIALLLDVMKGARNIIVLVPEMTHIEVLSPILKEVCKHRLAVLHGHLSGKRRKDAVDSILSGQADVVLGTRIAVCAPLHSVSLIAVLQEHNRAFKNLEGVRFHARDVAVMRGYLERSTVVLSSPSPSLESFYNTVKGKYSLIKPPEQFPRPRIEVINMKTAKKVTRYLSQRAVQAASLSIKSGESTLFFINRKGYSLIQCAECDTVETCPECKIPLILHKSKALLKCHYCGYTAKTPERCGKCRSARLETVGAGTQRIEADIRKHFHVEPLRFDTDALRENPALKELAGLLRKNETIVGTRAVSGKLCRSDALKLCIFLNPDLSLHVPDFRSSEILFQEIIGISENVKPQGLLLIQSRMPENYLFRCVRNYNFEDFFREELAMRRSLSYPPFSRIVVVTVSSKEEQRDAIGDCLSQPDERIEVVGPIETARKGIRTWKVLLKSQSKERLLVFARSFLKRIEKEKGTRVTVDVDPISI